MLKSADNIIRYAFYALFFLVPLVFYSGSFELFEYNKMMLTYALTVLIAAAWLIKLIITRFKALKRTPLDIFLLLYLASHILSTIFSIDPHTSIWGYYSRYHEGLLATVSYLLLYFAATSTLSRKDVLRILLFSFASGVIVALWGGLEHFGSSPSCLLITHEFNDSCWVQDVKNRVFATLGQPNWMAAYLDILILAVSAFVLSTKARSLKIFSALSVLLFAALLWTRSRSGVLGLMAGFVPLIVYHFWSAKSNFRSLVVFLASLGAVALIFGLPFESLTSHSAPATTVKQPSPYIDIGISESGDIRKIVWKGAVKIWQRYPLLGSGVETFAYAYYQDRPVEHNMVSEWDFLYNKAHNEFLNILATTGTLGFLTYLGIILAFSVALFKLLPKIKSSDYGLLSVALYGGWLSILVTNFFGFSVVIIGLFFFLIPAFVFLLSELEAPKKPLPLTSSTFSKVFSVVVILIALIFLWKLQLMWFADRSFAYGKNLDGVQRYTQAYLHLSTAVSQNPTEPTFRDELSYNEAVLALTLFNQASGSATTPLAGTNITAQVLVDKAINDSNIVITTSPNVLSFWKTRTKLFYTLSEINKQNLLESLFAIKKAAELAPTDAKVRYNLGLVQAQTGDLQGAIATLEETTKMKSDYSDAFYALGLYYDQLGQKEKARAQMNYILTKIGSDERAKKWLDENPK